jgi:hypothetical protein
MTFPANFFMKTRPSRRRCRNSKNPKIQKSTRRLESFGVHLKNTIKSRMNNPMKWQPRYKITPAGSGLLLPDLAKLGADLAGNRAHWDLRKDFLSDSILAKSSLQVLFTILKKLVSLCGISRRIAFEAESEAVQALREYLGNDLKTGQEAFALRASGKNELMAERPSRQANSLG